MSPGFEHAQKVAAFLGHQEHVKDVFLVGSMAREGDGHDIDIVVTSTDERALHWSEMARIAGDARLFDTQSNDFS